MCLQCCTMAVRYKDEVVPGWTLMRATKDYFDEWKKDQWALVRCNDPDYIWDATPILDPGFGLSDEQLEQLTNEDNAFLNAACEFNRNFKLDPLTGHKLIEAAKSVGFNPPQDIIGFWLFHRMAVIIRDSELVDDYAKERKNPPDP